VFPLGHEQFFQAFLNGGELEGEIARTGSARILSKRILHLMNTF
jgi:hypothetical protein